MRLGHKEILIKIGQPKFKYELIKHFD